MKCGLIGAVGCACLAFGAQGAFAQEAPLPITAALQSALDRHPLRGARVGIAVRRLSDGKKVFFSHGDELFQMASNTKIFTTAAALWRLGPDYEYRTSLIANGKLAAGALEGDLIVLGSGDPSFSVRVQGNPMAVPHQMALSSQQAGIREVRGDLVMDDRLFDRVWRAPSWPKEESLWWYASPVSALSFNDNCVEVRVSGASAPDSPAAIGVTPSFPYLRLVGRCTTCGKDRSNEVTFHREPDGSITVGGRVAAGDAEAENVAVDEPPLFLGAAVRAELETLGVRVIGATRLAKEAEIRSPDAREIFAWKSKLIDSISMANRRSQNFCAEQILKTLGAARYGKGTFDTGVAAVREFTRAAHLPDEAETQSDGCGLSPDDRATPDAVSALLEVIYRSKMQKPFYDSLAVNGEPETTLKKRMKDPALRGRIHAKTGTIKTGGISALSGYAQAADSEVYAFSILVNGFRSGALDQAWALEDAVCYALVGVPEKK